MKKTTKSKLDLEIQATSSARELKLLRLKISNIANIANSLSTLAGVNGNLEASQRLGLMNNLLLGAIDFHNNFQEE